MISRSLSLGAQLRALRKGRGLLETDLRRRVGSQLAVLCGIEADDDTPTIRRRIASTVAALLADAPGDVRRAVIVALAMEPDAQYPTLTGRRDWLAQTAPCDVRTVRRQEDRGFNLAATAADVNLAAAAADVDLAAVDVDPAAAAAGRGVGSVPAQRRPEQDWYVTAFRAIMRLTGPGPELIEERTIVAARPGLAEVVVAVSLPEPLDGRDGRPVEADVLYGGQIVRTDHPTSSHFRFVLRLPRSLRVGEAHDYAVIFRVPAGRYMRPHYAFQPLLPCEAFEVTVKFDPARVPTAVWRLDGVPPRVLDDECPTQDVLRPDSVGEVRLRFADLTQGLGYGIAWTPVGR